MRDVLFDWFINICRTLKASLPSKMFKTQCKVFYEQWLAHQFKEVLENKNIVILQPMDTKLDE